jgi:diguanylate cyclase (GGDEF)-like protein
VQDVHFTAWSLTELIAACLCWAVWFIGFSLRPVDAQAMRVVRSYRMVTLAVNLILTSLFLAHSGLVPAGAALWWTYLIATTLPPIGTRYSRFSSAQPIAPFEVAYWLASAMCAGGLLFAPSAFVGPERISTFGIVQATSLLPGLILTLVQVIAVSWSVSDRNRKRTRAARPIMGRSIVGRPVMGAGTLTITWFVYNASAFLEQISTSGWVSLPPVFWIGALALTFEFARLIHAQQGRMVLALGRANEELTRLSADLEARVEARTLELHRLAMFDPLTGLPNRSHGEQFLTSALQEAARTNHAVAVLMVDLNRFKNINDTAGHPVGDAALREVAARFQARIPEESLLARLGGDEFLVVMPDLIPSVEGASVQHSSNPNRMMMSAERVSRELVESLAGPVNINGTDFFLGASIGISLYPHDGADAATLQRLADIAMYRAKNEGLGHRAFDALLDADITERIEIESALRRALETNPDTAFHLVYQPIIEIRTGRVVSVEALLRWDDPVLQFGPAHFIPVAEESGLIVPLGNWVLLEACRQAALWQREDLAGAHVSVNVSTRQFERPDFVEIVKRTLDQTGLQPERLVLELLESVLVERFEETAAKIAQLRTLGVRLALDDFGTGYSSLAYLHRLTFDALKLDRSFTQTLGHVSRPRALVAASLSIAQEFGMFAVAEGVETREQAAELEILGCVFAQGFLYSRPLRPAQIAPLLRSGVLLERHALRDGR